MDTEKLQQLENQLKTLLQQLKQLLENSGSHNDIDNLKQKIEALKEQIDHARVSATPGKDADGGKSKNEPGPSRKSQYKVKTIVLTPKTSAEKVEPPKKTAKDRYEEKMVENAEFLKDITVITKQFDERRAQIFAPPKPTLSTLPPSGSLKKEPLKKFVVLTPKTSQVIQASDKSTTILKPSRSKKKVQVVLSPKESDQNKEPEVINPPQPTTTTTTTTYHTQEIKTLKIEITEKFPTLKKENYTVILSPKASAIPEPVQKDLNKLQETISKHPYSGKTKSSLKRVILSPKKQSRKSLVVIKSSHNIPSPKKSPIKLNKVHPEPEPVTGKHMGMDESKRSELDMAEKILAMMSEGNPKDKFLNQLRAFGIPDQRRLLRYLLEGDSHSFDFGGLMRKYYSYVLRSYTLINMQDNYREPYNFSTCFAGLDVSLIGSKAEEQEKEMNKKLKLRDEKQEDLKFVAVDEEHFKYLKQLADEQPTTIPLTVLKGLVEQAMPILLDTYRTYARSLSNRHPCTKNACQQYLRMKSRLQVYNKMEKPS